MPRNKREIHSFIGQENVLRRFITNFVDTLRKVTNMLRKDCEIKWNIESKKSFNNIKKEITEALVLVSPDFSKYFIFFSINFSYA